jgi:hypothetical protein
MAAANLHAPCDDKCTVRSQQDERQNIVIIGSAGRAGKYRDHPLKAAPAQGIRSTPQSRQLRRDGWRDLGGFFLHALAASCDSTVLLQRRQATSGAREHAWYTCAAASKLRPGAAHACAIKERRGGREAGQFSSLCGRRRRLQCRGSSPTSPAPQHGTARTACTCGG